MIDIHSHILWGLDDGPSAIEQSLAMLEVARSSGTKTIVVTPHCSPQYSFDEVATGLRIAELSAAAGSIAIHRGCEFHLNFDHLDDLLQTPHRYTINAHSYLLLELPDHHIGKFTDKVLQRLIETSVVPVIAHPERNACLQQDVKRLKHWVEIGCLVQITAGSLTGVFGGQVKAATTRLLDLGLVHVVASDAHDAVYRNPSLAEGAAAVRAAGGEDAVEILFTSNPDRIVQGWPVQGGIQKLWTSSRRCWWFFGRSLRSA